MPGRVRAAPAVLPAVNSNRRLSPTRLQGRGKKLVGDDGPNMLRYYPTTATWDYPENLPVRFSRTLSRQFQKARIAPTLEVGPCFFNESEDILCRVRFNRLVTPEWSQ